MLNVSAEQFRTPLSVESVRGSRVREEVIWSGKAVGIPMLGGGVS